MYQGNPTGGTHFPHTTPYILYLVPRWSGNTAGCALTDHLNWKKKTLNPTLFEPYGNHAQAVATAHPSGRRHVALGSIGHFRIISKMPWREPWLQRALRGAATSRFAIWQTSRSFYKMFPALKRQRSSKDFPFQTALEWFQDEKAKQVASRQALRELPSELEQEIMNFTFDYVLRSLFK